MSFQKVKTGVFDRTGTDAVSDRVYFGTIGLVLSYGFIMTAVIASKMAPAYAHGIDWVTLILLGLVAPIIGIIISVKSDNPIISFIGYNLIVCPFGVVLSPILNVYSPHVIQNAFFVTSVDVVVMSVAAVAKPDFFSKLGGILFVSLLGLLFAGIIQIIFHFHFGLYSWLGAAVFSLYVGYDWWRATTIPKTLDNAVDICVDLYLDIINLFLFILQILGKKD